MNRSFVTKREHIWLWAISFSWLFLNVLTASRSPTVWIDEVMFIDPAVSFHLGQGFTSTAWYGQSRLETFAGCPILFQGLLIPWMQVTGFSITAVRSLGFCLALAGVWMLWSAAVRMDWVRHFASRVGLFAMLLTGYGMTCSYRCGRYETLLMLLMGATALVLTCRGRWTLVVLGLIGVATSWAALHGPVFAAVVMVMAWAFIGRSFSRSILAFGAGGVAGAAGWLWFLHIHDPEGRIIKAINRMFITSSKTWPSGVADPSMILIFLVLASLCWKAWREGALRLTSPVVFSLVSTAVVPLVVWVVGRYPIYYSWMAWLLLLPGAFHALDKSWETLRPLAKLGLLVVLLAAGTMGLPARLALTTYEWKMRDYTPVVELAAKHLKPGDWVFMDYAGYFAVKPIVEVAATEWFIPAMTEEDKKRLDWLMVAPVNLERWRSELGGEWEDSGSAVEPPKRGAWGGAAKYDLRLYRRKHSSTFQTEPANVN